MITFFFFVISASLYLLRDGQRWTVSTAPRSRSSSTSCRLRGLDSRSSWGSFRALPTTQRTATTARLASRSSRRARWATLPRRSSKPRRNTRGRCCTRRCRRRTSGSRRRWGRWTAVETSRARGVSAAAGSTGTSIVRWLWVHCFTSVFGDSILNIYYRRDDAKKERRIGAFHSERRESKPKAWVRAKTLKKSRGRLPPRYSPGLILLNLSDQIRTRFCIVPRCLLVHEVINYGVPICAFYGDVTPRRSRHKPYLERSGTFASSLVSSDFNWA